MSVAALVLVPLFGLVFDNTRHPHYDFPPGADQDRWCLNGSRRHHPDHACYRSNYGFIFPFMDFLFGKALLPKAADDILARSGNGRRKEQHLESRSFSVSHDLQSLLYLLALPALVAWQGWHGFAWPLYGLTLFLTLGIGVIHHTTRIAACGTAAG